MDRIDQVSPVLDDIFEPGGNEEGVDIYILDTGKQMRYIKLIYSSNYDEFDGNRALHTGYDPFDYNFSTNQSGRDTHQHRTHVASLPCVKFLVLPKEQTVTTFVY